MPYNILLAGLTGQQLTDLKDTYNRIPTPLERIEILLSLILHSWSDGENEFKGSAMPDRFKLWQQADDSEVQTDDEEGAILSNLALHMTIHNASRGA